MSIRELTEEQFSDGTTVDGTRLDSALDSMGERLSSVPKGDLAQRHMQTQVVCGWSPPTAQSGTSKTNEIQYPWLSYTNTVAGSPYENPSFRFKSTGDGADGTSSQYAMTIPIKFSHPVIIQAVNVLMLTNTAYYKWNIADFGLNNLGPQLLISIDDPYLPEDNNMSSVSLHKACSAYDAFDLTGDAADTGISPTADMAPDYPVATPLRGAYLKTEELNIPLAANARLRFSLINVNDSSEAYSMWSAFTSSITVTFLEAVTDG